MTPDEQRAEVDQVIERLRAELRAEGVTDDDATTLRLAVLKLIREQRDGYHHNGRAYTMKERA